jgi:hypothetical protein
LALLARLFGMAAKLFHRMARLSTDDDLLV